MPEFFVKKYTLSLLNSYKSNYGCLEISNGLINFKKQFLNELKNFDNLNATQFPLVDSFMDKYRNYFTMSDILNKNEFSTDQIYFNGKIFNESKKLKNSEDFEIKMSKKIENENSYLEFNENSNFSPNFNSYIDKNEFDQYENHLKDAFNFEIDFFKINDYKFKGADTKTCNFPDGSKTNLIFTDILEELKKNISRKAIVFMNFLEKSFKDFIETDKNTSKEYHIQHLMELIVFKKKANFLPYDLKFKILSVIDKPDQLQNLISN